MAASVGSDSREIRLLAQRLRIAGQGDLQKQLLRDIRATTKPTIRKVRANALATLPRRGGLAAKVAASKIGTRTRTTSGQSAGVFIKGTDPRINLNRINAGQLRHPVFGNRRNWREQSVRAGWFDDPIKGDLPHILGSIRGVVADINARITRGL